MAKADKNAWEAAHKAARKLLGREEKDYKYKPLGSIWYEISAQLRQNGDSVDLEKTRGIWTSESQQQALMHAILQEAGFSKEGEREVYRWTQDSKAAPEAVPASKTKAKTKAKDDAKAKAKDDGKAKAKDDGKAKAKDDGKAKAKDDGKAKAGDKVEARSKTPAKPRKKKES